MIEYLITPLFIYSYVDLLRYAHLTFIGFTLSIFLFFGSLLAFPFVPGEENLKPVKRGALIMNFYFWFSLTAMFASKQDHMEGMDNKQTITVYILMAAMQIAAIALWHAK